MNLEKFKNVTTKPCDIHFDEKYAKKLSRLPQSRKTGRVFAAAGTVAAAIAIVAVVGVWALIGHGVRGTQPVQNKPTAVAGSETEYTVTDELVSELHNKVIGKYDVYCFLEFDEQNPLSLHEILQINRNAENNKIIAHDPVTSAEYTSSVGLNLAYVTGREINEYASKTFGITPAPNDDTKFGCYIELGTPCYAGFNIKRVSSYELSDGTLKVTLELNNFKDDLILEYVASSLTEPIYFTAYHKKGETLNKDYADEKIYRAICSELDGYEYIESYLLYIDSAPVKYNDGSYSANILLTPTFTDGYTHSVLGSVREYDNKTTEMFECTFEPDQNGNLKLVKAEDSAC